MGRTELTLVIGTALVVAVMVGWMLRWFVSKMNTTGPIADDEAMGRMHEAEAAREAAEEHAADVERQARQEIARLDAELDAAMSGLGNARREAEAWQTEAAAWRTETEEVREDLEEVQELNHHPKETEEHTDEHET